MSMAGKQEDLEYLLFTASCNLGYLLKRMYNSSIQNTPTFYTFV